MVSIMNEYVANIQLLSDDMTKNLLNVALLDCTEIEEKSIILKGNRYIVDIKLGSFDVQKAILVMNRFMEHSRYHYSSYYVRFNEGNMVRYRYASCKENKEGFYCDVMIR